MARYKPDALLTEDDARDVLNRNSERIPRSLLRG